MTSDSDSPGGPGTQTAHSAQTARVDHLVVVASNLEEGVVWCKRTLGITPGPGGQHPLMGTHNRLFRIATVNYPCAYFEIIAMDSSSQGLDKTRTSRWFDMDSEALQASVTADGPRLVHFVANTPDIVAAADALQTLGLDRGPVVAASRETPRGLLQWQITVRDDGQRLFQGGLPTSSNGATCTRPMAWPNRASRCNPSMCATLAQTYCKRHSVPLVFKVWACKLARPT